MHHFTIGSCFLACAVGCGVTEHTAAVSSAIDGAPSTLSLRTPFNCLLDIRSGPPLTAGHGDSDIYLKLSGPEGESANCANALFIGGIASVDGQHNTAGIAPVVAALLGVTTLDEVVGQTGLTITPVEIQYASAQLPRPLVFAMVQQAALYVTLEDGPDGGALANSYIAGVGINPCPTAPVVKGL